MPMTSWTAPRARRYEKVNVARDRNRQSEAQATADELESSTRTT